MIANLSFVGLRWVLRAEENDLKFSSCFSRPGTKGRRILVLGTNSGYLETVRRFPFPLSAVSLWLIYPVMILMTSRNDKNSTNPTLYTGHVGCILTAAGKLHYL